MAVRALPQPQHVSLDAVRVRVAEFPRLSELVREQVDRLSRKSMHRDTAPRVLALLGERGRNTHALLRELKRSIELFDALSPEGWVDVRSQLVQANNRPKFLATLGEIVVARWLQEQGMVVAEFEPQTADGRRTDLLVQCRAEELFVEVASPGPQDDAIETLNTELHIALERVESGLVIEVEGYHVDASRPETVEVTRKNVAQVVREFRRNAAKVDIASLPAAVVTPASGQPVSITVVDYNRAAEGYTHVTLSSSETGLVPNVRRLVRRIRDERLQLPDDAPGAVLVDLSRWSELRGAGYYLDEASKQLATHSLPAFVGSFVWQGDRFYPDLRSTLHAETNWLDTAAGSALSRAWA